MTYQVLARKWRPKTFTELVGQQHVITALTNSISNNKLHHAYLFTGTRGVGKTTIARVLAKALNCEQGPTATPCLTCPTCIALAEGRYVDLIEVDAASRTRVEDTKELLDNVQYMPTQGRYKIYLIDEIHMLSGHSFNALLKTLEEPPAHVIFLLATTDPQKIPVTVLSRCLQFTLKPLSSAEIASYLAVVLKGEEIKSEEKALKLLAKAAGGSLRDSLSLLDQAIAYSQNYIRYQDVLSMLSTVDDLCIHRLLAAIAHDNGPEVLSICHSMANDGVDFSQVLERFIEILHAIVVIQCIPDKTNNDETAALIKFAHHFSKEDMQLFYEICVHGRQALASVPQANIGFEMTMLRMMSFKLSLTPPLNEEELLKPDEKLAMTDTVSIENKKSIAKDSQFQHKKKTEDIEGNSLVTQPKISAVNAVPIIESGDVSFEEELLGGEQKKQMPLSSQHPVVDMLAPMAEPAMQEKPAVIKAEYAELPWIQLVEALPLAGMAKTVIMHCNLIEKREGQVRLGIEENYQAMLTSTAKTSIEKALKQYWQCTFKLSFEVLSGTQANTPAVIKTQTHNESLKQAKEALSEDTCFNEIVSRFDGQVDSSTAKLITK